MALGFFLMVTGVALLWSGLKNKDLREAIPKILSGDDPNDAAAISQPLPDDTPQSFTDTTTAQNLGEQTTWSKSQVFTYGLALQKAFGVRIISHCRTNSITRSGNVSLHDKRNGCRALDLKGTKAEMTKLAKWAVAQKPAFQEVIYNAQTTPGISDAVLADHDGRRGTEHVHIGFPQNGKMPVIPGLQSGGGGGGGSF